MKKSFLVISILFLIIIVVISNINFNKNFESKVIKYNGNKLKVSIDGVESPLLPTDGNYYLANYTCKSNDTVVEWDRETYQLKVNNKKSGVSCYLEFKKNPLLSEMPVGSYVAYEGEGGTVGSTNVSCQKDRATPSESSNNVETESPNSCLGQNAREDLEESESGVYGHCNQYGYSKFITTGWRIAYINNSKTQIVSAGAPECVSREAATGNTTYIKTANAKALKYCNSDYVDGNCSCASTTSGQCDSMSSDAWAINDTDFYYMTKATSGYGKRLLDGSSSLGDKGGDLGNTLYCFPKKGYRECGYGHDLLDNGSEYWFAAGSSSTSHGVYWTSDYRRVVQNSNNYVFGLRPVISLSSSVVVTGGEGTMDDPYTIGNNTFWINNGVTEISNSSRTNITLKLMGVNVDKMCISTNTSVCTNYIDFADTYTLDWSNEPSGDKLVYVYYKNSDGKVIATMNKSVKLLES